MRKENPLSNTGSGKKQVNDKNLDKEKTSEESISTLQDCFETTDWHIDKYSVSAYISNCIQDVVPTVNVRTFYNQKPCVNGNVSAKLETSPHLSLL